MVSHFEESMVFKVSYCVTFRLSMRTLLLYRVNKNSSTYTCQIALVNMHQSINQSVYNILADFLDVRDELNRVLGKIYVWGALPSNADTTDTAALGRRGRVMSRRDSGSFIAVHGQFCTRCGWRHLHGRNPSALPRAGQDWAGGTDPPARQLSTARYRCQGTASGASPVAVPKWFRLLRAG